VARLGEITSPGEGMKNPVDERDAWKWLRNPLPPGNDEALFANLRLQLGLPEQTFFTDRGFWFSRVFRAACHWRDPSTRLFQRA